MLWAYGVTTVPERLSDLLPRTLVSLSKGGFFAPQLFVDGARDAGFYQRFGLETVTRYPRIKTYGNWLLAASELLIRNPQADRYAIFQDDFVCVTNLKDYLSKATRQEDAYWNLYTFPSNSVGKREWADKILAPEGYQGFYESNGDGRGALALVFSRDSLKRILSHRDIYEKPNWGGRDGCKGVDGFLSKVTKDLGIIEYVHNPSLTQHTGLISSMGNKPHLPAPSFPGEDFDAMRLWRKKHE